MWNGYVMRTRCASIMSIDQIMMPPHFFSLGWASTQPTYSPNCSSARLVAKSADGIRMSYMPREFLWTTGFPIYLAHCSRSSFAANSVQVSGGWPAGNGSGRVAALKQAKITNHDVIVL
jgi:hypothetical protein